MYVTEFKQHLSRVNSKSSSYAQFLPSSPTPGNHSYQDSMHMGYKQTGMQIYCSWRLRTLSKVRGGK